MLTGGRKQLFELAFAGFCAAKAMTTVILNWLADHLIKQIWVL